MRAKLSLATALALAVVVMAGSQPAGANVNPGAGPDGISIRVWLPGEQGGGAGESGERAFDVRFCQYYEVDGPVSPDDPHAGEQGRYVTYVCVTDFALWFQQLVFEGLAPPPAGGFGLLWLPAGAPAVEPEVLAREAAKYLPLPAPEIRTNPPADRAQLVSLATWLWLGERSWGSRMATASVPGLSATVTATPVRVEWRMGDGHTVTCRGPGVPFDPVKPGAPPACSHTYRQSSAGQPDGRFTVTATAVWEVAWRSEGMVAQAGSLPPVSRQSQVGLRVAEVQALNTSDAP